MDKNQTKIILSMRMAGYLAFMGNILVDVKDDLKGSNRKVYVFINTDKLKKDMNRYKDFLAKVS